MSQWIRKKRMRSEVRLRALEGRECLLLKPFKGPRRGPSKSMSFVTRIKQNRIGFVTRPGYSDSRWPRCRGRLPHSLHRRVPHGATRPHPSHPHTAAAAYFICQDVGLLQVQQRELVNKWKQRNLDAPAGLCAVHTLGWENVQLQCPELHLKKTNLWTVFKGVYGGNGNKVRCLFTLTYRT